MSVQVVTAAVTGLCLVLDAALFWHSGTIPDVLAGATVALIGGHLGMAVPSSKPGSVDAVQP